MLQKHVENSPYVNLLTKGQQMLAYHFFVKFEFKNVSELSLDQKACLQRNIERFKVQYFFRVL